MTNVQFHVTRWRKSSRSSGSEGQCVEVAALWRKSSHSGGEGQECVEVAALPTGRMIGMRDSKDPGGPVLSFTPVEWSAFVRRVKHDRAS
jgi:hypothetical protein